MGVDTPKDTEFDALGAWCASDTHLLPPSTISKHKRAFGTKQKQNEPARHLDTQAATNALESPFASAERVAPQPMSRCPSIEEQFCRSRRTALSEFYKVVDIQNRRRLLKECEKMKGVEKYAAIVFPELPVGCGLDRVLWAFSNLVEGSAVYIVQLSPLIVPMCIALTWLTAKHVGAVAALLVGALACAAMFWAEGTMRERNVLRSPAGVLKAHSVGRHAVGKAKPDKNGKSPTVTGQSATGVPATLPGSISQHAKPISAASPASLGRMPSASRQDSSGSAQALQELSSGLRTLTASLYGTEVSSQLVLGSLQDCHSHLTQIATEVGIPGPADASYASLRSSLSALRNAVGC